VPQKRVQSRVNEQTTKLISVFRTKTIREMKKNKNSDAEYKKRTLYMPKYTRNTQGIWVVNKWGPTPGLVWEDTRLHTYNQRIPRMTVEQFLPVNYYPPCVLIKLLTFIARSVFFLIQIYLTIRNKY